MSSLLGGDKPPRRRPSFRGALQMDISNGQLRARAWPTHRKRVRSVTIVNREQTFANVQRAWNYYFDAGQQWMIEATGPTPMLPRDMWTMLQYNRLFAFQLLDGRTIYPMPAKIEVERALDAITQTPGFTVVKTTNGWTGREAGGGLSGFWPVNRPDPNSFPNEFLASGTALIHEPTDYGWLMRDPNTYATNITRLRLKTKPVWRTGWQATLGIKLPGSARQLSAFLGICATNGTRAFQIGYAVNGGAGEIRATYFTDLNTNNSGNTIGFVFTQPFWYFRMTDTGTAILMEYSSDGGRTWENQNVLSYSGRFVPTHVGIGMISGGAISAINLRQSVIYWQQN